MANELVSCSTTVHHPTESHRLYLFLSFQLFLSCIPLPFIFVGLGNFVIMSVFLLISFSRLILSGISFPVVKWLLEPQFFVRVKLK